MTTALAIADQALTPELAELARKAVILHDTGDIEPSTRKTYASLLRSYDAFCTKHGIDPNAPTTVALYVTDRQDRAADSQSTLTARLAAIARRAREHGIENPVDHPYVRQVARHANRQLRLDSRRPPERQASPATVELLPQLIAAADGPTRLRDVALVLFGFALARRGAELAALDYEDLTWSHDGVTVRIRVSKTNKTGKAEFIGIPAFSGHPYCPVAALQAWLTAANIHSGPIFLTMSIVPKPHLTGPTRMRREDIARRMAALAKRAGLIGFWRSHSLRRGFVTSAEERDVARSRTRLHTGWKDDQMFSRYAQHKNLIRQSPVHDFYTKP